MKTPTSPRSTVDAALEQCYVAFSGYRFDEEQVRYIERVMALGGPSDYTDRIAKTRLSGQAADDLYPALSWVRLTGPQHADQIRHFLPRLLEIMINGEIYFWEPADIGERLLELRWETWSGIERSAVEDLLDAWLRWTLTDPEASWWSLEGALELGRVLRPASSPAVSAFLWNDPQGQCRKRLVRLLLESAEDWRGSTLEDTALSKHLCDADVIDALEDAFFVVPEEEGDAISAALDVIDWYLRH